ncbi:TIGR02281 family clan AA aspartic protease [Motiliproteus sp. SC1-56]|uniref:retropepsin-like aspartic protease family protein n=1 Tax=Motiliproteus sp. SC1-56 TaxID=2799565 RepID=UPI001A8FC11A|nr:retropepsin-like aspartic protease [Motiliproteus sp. SC1-56]
MNAPTGKRLGQGMWVAFWALLLALLALMFGRWEEARYNPNSELSVREGPGGSALLLQPNHQGHYLFDGHIDETPATFLIDTGASDVVIPKTIADRAGLKGQGRFSARTANGTISVSRTRIERLRLGPLTLHDVRATINPHMTGEVLLGMSALKRLELSHSADGLVLRRPGGSDQKPSPL